MKWLPVFIFLAACSNPLSLLTGGGPNVAANVQAGAENDQTIGIGQTNQIQQRLVKPQARSIEQSTGETSVRSEEVDTLVVEGDVPAWLIIAFAAAVFLDSPLRWPGQIIKGIRGVRRRK